MTEASVLVVDDEADVLELMVDTLHDGGYCAVSSQNAAEALAALKVFRFGVIVTDVMMLGLTGLELLELVKRDSPDVEVVLVTGYVARDLVAAAWSKGAFGFVEKPFAPEQLLDTVAQALERRDLRRQSWPSRWTGDDGVPADVRTLRGLDGSTVHPVGRKRGL